MTATLKLVGDPKKLIEPVARMWARRKEFMAQVGEELVKNVHERFDKTKSSPDGRKWAPWAPSTKKAYQKRGGGSLLVRSGALRNSIRFNVSDKQVSVYSPLKYGQYLQEGTSNMPARPFIGIGKRDEDSMKQIWEKWIRQ